MELLRQAYYRQGLFADLEQDVLFITKPYSNSTWDKDKFADKNFPQLRCRPCCEKFLFSSFHLHLKWNCFNYVDYINQIFFLLYSGNYEVRRNTFELIEQNKDKISSEDFENMKKIWLR